MCAWKNSAARPPKGRLRVSRWDWHTHCIALHCGVLGSPGDMKRKTNEGRGHEDARACGTDGDAAHSALLEFLPWRWRADVGVGAGAQRRTEDQYST
jgi:hypothetical protein